jgi:hypothetical protein
MTKRAQKKARRATRPASARPERQQDPRLAATPVTAIGDELLSPGTWVVLVEPVEMDDGRELQWHPPQPIAFSLVEAKKLCDRAVPARRQIVGNLVRRDNGTYMPTNSHRTLDVLSELWSAVLHSFAAVETIANDSIDRLPQDAVVTIGKSDRTRDVPHEDMVRTLNLDEKFGLAVPMLDVGEPIKGRRPWERYLHLKGIRDALVHVKDRGVDPDRAIRTAYDRLLLGDADTCAKDALDIVQAARPGFLGCHVVEYLGAG